VFAYLTKDKFQKIDRLTNLTVVSLAHLQLLFGLILYVISPTVAVFISNFPDAIHERVLRFFGMEHPLMMLLSITLISIGAFIMKRSKSDNRKFILAIVFYGLSLVMIVISVPWEFSPMVSRPFFRFI
jgi:hypothetical protein